MCVSPLQSLLKKLGHCVFHDLRFANCFTLISTVLNNWQLDLEVWSKSDENFLQYIIGCAVYLHPGGAQSLMVFGTISCPW